MSSGKGKQGLKKLFFFSGAALGVLLVGMFLFRVAILETIGLAALHSFGFKSATLNIQHIDFKETRVVGLSLDDRFEIEKLSVGYSLSSLFQGTADWISINGFTIDVSKPDEGALKTILALAKTEETASDKKTSRSRPSISVTGGSIIGTYDTRKFQSEVNFDLTSDFKITGEVHLKAEVGTAAGPIKMDGLTLTFEGNAMDKSGSMELKNGVVSHDVEVPDWTPLNISGSAKIAEQSVNFMTVVGLGNDTPLFRMEGRHDLRANSGEMDVDVQDVTFNKAGLQPSNLTSYLTFIPPIDTLLSSQSKVTWDKDILVTDSVIFAKDTRVIGPDYSVEVDLINVAIKAFYNLKTGKHKINVGTEDLTALVSQGTRKYAIDELNATLDIEEKGKDLSLQNISFSVRHVSLNPDFIPLVIKAAGKTTNGGIDFEGNIADEQKRLQLPFSGRHNLENNTGYMRIKLLPAKFTKEGLQPKDLSGFFAPVAGSITGQFQGMVITTWDRLAGVTFPVVTGRLRGGGYENGDINVHSLDLKLESEKIIPNQSFKIYFSQINGSFKDDEKEASIKETSATIEIKKGWRDADFYLHKAVLLPGKGMVVKPVITLSGSSTLKDNVLNFKGEAKTDYLGSFTKWTGRYDLKASTGNANAKISPIEFEEGGLQLTDLVDLADQSLILSGKISSDIQVRWQSTSFKSSAKIVFDGIGIKTDEVEFRGITGVVDVDELQPLTIASPQELTSEKVISAVTLNQPSVRFRVLTEKGIPVLYLDELKVGVVGGHATITDAILDTGSKVNRINVQLSNIDLEEVMALSDVQGFSASGTLSGEIPLSFDGETLLIDVGVLETEGPGILQLKSDKARQALAGGGDQTKLLFDILENFQYSELSVRIKKLPSGEDTVLLHTKGSNPDVENSRPVILNINLTTNLDKIFDTVLNGYRLSGKALRATVRKRKK